jgi:hypothetical protein
MKNQIFLFFIFSLYLSTFISSFESQDSFQKRVKFYEKINQFSENRIKLGISQEKGLSCIANDYIESGRKILTIPKKFTLCSFDIFPFKYEITAILQTYTGYTNLIGIKEDEISLYLLTYHLAYYLFAPKEEIKKYIFENKLEEYYYVNEIDESVRDSFPDNIFSASTVIMEHYGLLKEMGYEVKGTEEIEKIYTLFHEKLPHSKHADIIYPWTASLTQFKWAFAIIYTRAYHVDLNRYLVLENRKSKDMWYSKNLELNREIHGQTGNCILAYPDLCNHHQPKLFDLSDKRHFAIETEPNNMLINVGEEYYPGQEIVYSYSSNPPNHMLLLHYGFILPNNSFNFFTVKVDDPLAITPVQLNICKEVSCFETAVKEARDINRVKLYELQLGRINSGLINYARVRQLKSNADSRSVIKSLMNQKPINFLNEVSAWLFYHKSILNVMFDGKVSLNKSIKKGQKNRRLAQVSETKEEFFKYKGFELIYLMDASYKKIFTKHLNGSLNQIILNTEKELQSLKLKYLK